MITVFLGPSLPLDEATAILPTARFVPPVQQGDVLRAIGPVEGDTSETIAIIDGFFDLVPAVWHKEILVALERGVTVCGSSSMGALRAAELHPFGMVGVGRVFEWFRDGMLEDDDEVAVAHGPEENGWRSLSVAMVDIRHIYDEAVTAGVVDRYTADLLVATAKRRFYPERSHRAALADGEEAGIDPAEVAALRDFMGPSPASLKAIDAREVLDHLAQGTLPPPTSDAIVRVERTVFLDQLQTDVARSLGGPADADGLSENAQRVGETSEVLRKKAALRFLARREADRIGLTATDDEVLEFANRFRRECGLLEHQQVVDWMAAEAVTEQMWVDFITDAVLIEKLQRYHHRPLERLAADQARVTTARLHGREGHPGTAR